MREREREKEREEGRGEREKEKETDIMERQTDTIKRDSMDRQILWRDRKIERQT